MSSYIVHIFFFIVLLSILLFLMRVTGGGFRVPASGMALIVTGPFGRRIVTDKCIFIWPIEDLSLIAAGGQMFKTEGHAKSSSNS